MDPSSLCIVFIHQFGEFLLFIHQIFVNDAQQFLQIFHLYP